MGIVIASSVCCAWFVEFGMREDVLRTWTERNPEFWEACDACVMKMRFFFLIDLRCEYECGLSRRTELRPDLDSNLIQELSAL
jgi:hypothetical protein